MTPSGACPRCASYSCSDDLCDVVVQQVAPIIHHPYNVLYGDIVRKALDLDAEAPLQGDDAMRFLEALGRAYDATRMHSCEGIGLNNTDRVGRYAAGVTEPWAAHKARLKAYLRNGGSILDPEDEIGLPYDIRFRALTAPNCGLCLLWQPEDWEEWEHWMRVDPIDRPTAKWLSERFSWGGKFNVRTLVLYWGEDYFEGAQDRARQRQAAAAPPDSEWSRRKKTGAQS